jgi:predicted porin
MNQEIDLAINLQLANKFTLSSSINHASMQEINGSGSIYRGFITQGIANYAFNRFTDLRVIAQYNHFDQSTMLQPLLQYQPSAFTLFYIGGAIQDGDWQGFVKWQRQIGI